MHVNNSRTTAVLSTAGVTSLTLLLSCALEVASDGEATGVVFDTIEQHSAATPDEARRWPNGVVPYQIDSGFSDNEVIRIEDVMEEWRDLTKGAIRFEAWDEHEDDYIFINEETDLNARSCRTNGKRGNVGGRFDLWLTESVCSNRRVFHELGHVLGLEHEQKRSDRDSYIWVTTNVEAIENADFTENDFSKMSSSWNVGAFDLNSIMLYNPTVGVIESLPRPACCPSGACDTPNCFYPGEMINKTGSALPSDLDVKAVQALYGVPADWHRDTTWCRSGNHLHSLDVDGNGRDDLLCHTTIGSNTGRRQVDLSNDSGHFWSIEFDSNTHANADDSWCFGANNFLYTGDFDGDGQEDLLCHNRSTGQRRVDLANNDNEFWGANWSSTNSWCTGNKTLHVGDFDGNGRDDILCLDANGRRQIDYSNAAGEFAVTDWDSHTDPAADPDWCFGSGNRLYVGRFDANLRDDLLCHDMANGRRRVDFAESGGKFRGTNWDSDTDGGNFCWGERQLFVADISNDGRADVLCFNKEIGSISRRLTDQDGKPKGSFWAGEIGFCKTEDGELHMGDYNGDGRVDALCHNVATGHKAIRFAQSNNRL